MQIIIQKKLIISSNSLVACNYIKKEILALRNFQEQRFYRTSIADLRIHDVIEDENESTLAE